MKILGLQKLTLLDFPGHVAAIVFTGGCNFRCPFCQNSSLVLSPETLPFISEAEFEQFLHKRQGILDGICVTGGEPTLHTDLPEFLNQIKSFGYLVKLDTNGTNPDMLQLLLDRKLLDYIAMDIKAGPSNYTHVCGLNYKFDGAIDKPEQLSYKAETDARSKIPWLLENVYRSVNILKSSDIDYEFRTTVVNGLHSEQDFKEIASWLSGCPRYFLQSFRDCPEVLQQGHSFSSFSKEEMLHFLEIVQKEIPQAALRGI